MNFDAEIKKLLRKTHEQTSVKRNFAVSLKDEQKDEGRPIGTNLNLYANHETHRYVCVIQSKMNKDTYNKKSRCKAV